MSNQKTEKLLEMKTQDNDSRNRRTSDLNESTDDNNFLASKNDESSMTDSIIDGVVSGR